MIATPCTEVVYFVSSVGWFVIFVREESLFVKNLFSSSFDAKWDKSCQKCLGVIVSSDRMARTVLVCLLVSFVCWLLSCEMCSGQAVCLLRPCGCSSCLRGWCISWTGNARCAHGLRGHGFPPRCFPSDAQAASAGPHSKRLFPPGSRHCALLLCLCCALIRLC